MTIEPLKCNECVDMVMSNKLKKRQHFTEGPYCSQCDGDIDFSSESETYDYGEDMDGKEWYLCEECLEEIRVEAENQG